MNFTTHLASQASVEQRGGSILLGMVYIDIVTCEQHVNQHYVALRGGEGESGATLAFRRVDYDILADQKTL